MRILLLTQFFQPEPNFKGLPLAQALRDRGHEVEVLTGFPNYPGGKLYNGYRIRHWQKETMDGINVIRVPLFPSHSRNGFRRILNYLTFGLSAFLLGPCLIKKPCRFRMLACAEETERYSETQKLSSVVPLRCQRPQT